MELGRQRTWELPDSPPEPPGLTRCLGNTALPHTFEAPAKRAEGRPAGGQRPRGPGSASRREHGLSLGLSSLSPQYLDHFRGKRQTDLTEALTD